MKSIFSIVATGYQSVKREKRIKLSQRHLKEKASSWKQVQKIKKILFAAKTGL